MDKLLGKRFHKQLVQEIEKIGFIKQDKKHIFHSNNKQEIHDARVKANRLIDNWKSQFNDIHEKVEIDNFGVILEK